MNLHECNDDSFGPTVQGCRGNFDFTKTFERIFFCIIPNALFLLGALVRIYDLSRQPRIIRGRLFHLLKLVSNRRISHSTSEP